MRVGYRPGRLVGLVGLVGPMTASATVRLSRHRVELALHRLQSGPVAPAASEARGGASADAVPLLRLHALGGRAVEPGPMGFEAWPGPVWGLDFTGHGASSRPVGGGYSPELLLADADAALAYLGPVVVAGWGLGAYVGLLLAGARPSLVRALVLAEGAGLAGASTDASVVHIIDHPPLPIPANASPAGADPAGESGEDPGADPFAWAELQVDPRPAAYALGYLRRAAGHPGRPAGPVAVVAVDPGPQPGWLHAVEAEESVAGRDRLGVGAGARTADRVAAALALLAGSDRR